MLRPAKVNDFEEAVASYMEAEDDEQAKRLSSDAKRGRRIWRPLSGMFGKQTNPFQHVRRIGGQSH